MLFQFGFYSSLLLISFSQGIVYSVLLLIKAYQNEKNDSLAIENYIKGYELDPTNIEVLRTIASSYRLNRKFKEAASYYQKLTTLPKASFVDWF